MAEEKGKDSKKPPIVVKRIKKGHHGHHGGAWKIAYADFVTAMMAFFLLMWLLSSQPEEKLKGISEYFQTPLQVAIFGGQGTGDATSVLKGGGTDITRREGQVKNGDVDPEKKAMLMKEAKNDIARQESLALDGVRARFEAAIEANAVLRALREQIRLDITSEGLRIQIVDAQNRPMFDTGSARLKDYTREILRELAKSLNGTEFRISLAGHTDAMQYASGERGYSNWELSADRANASRRELVNAGLSETKIARVTGLASSVLFDRTDPQAPVNRRISIVILNRRAEEALQKDGASIDVSNAQDAEPGRISQAVGKRGI